MRFAWLVVAMLGCSKAPPRERTVESEGAASAVGARMTPADAAIADAPPVADAPGIADASPTAPSPAGPPKKLGKSRMVGPFPTAKAACLAAPACGGTVYNDKTFKIEGPAGKAVCTYWPQVAPGDPPEDPEETTLATPTALLASVMCAAPRGIRSWEEQYYLFVKTAAGWWRAPAFSFGYNDKYCGDQLSATWDTRGGHTIARVTTSIVCTACNKQGSQEDGIDFTIVADTARTPPVAYDALLTGQHERQSLDPDGVTDEDCPKVETDVVLSEVWADPRTVVLSGPASWNKVSRDRHGVHLNVGRDAAPSGAGTYTLE